MIYGDVLVAVNFIINLFVLKLTARLTGVKAKRWRQYIGALAGGVAAFVIFIPVYSLWFDLLTRAGSTMLVVGIAYGGLPVKTIAKITLVFFTAGFLLAGLVLGIWFLFPSDRLAFANGVLYFNITPLLLVGCVGAAYLFVCLFDRVFAKGTGRQEPWRVLVRRQGREVIFDVLCDTGSSLREPFSGLPVLVAGYAQLRDLLTPEEKATICSGKDGCASLRPVFYRGLGGGGMLYAFRPDTLILTKDGPPMMVEGYVAISPEPIGGGGYQGVFHPEMVQLFQSQPLSTGGGSR